MLVHTCDAATSEVEVERSWSEPSQGKIVKLQKNNWKQKGWGVAQVAESFAEQVGGLEFNPQYCKNKTSPCPWVAGWG
jgi:hypothetical protein